MMHALRHAIMPCLALVLPRSAHVFGFAVNRKFHGKRQPFRFLLRNESETPDTAAAATIVIAMITKMSSLSITSTDWLAG